MEKKGCPECGCTELGKGRLSGYAALMPLGKVFSMGSEIVIDLCTDCGYVLGMRVLKPEKFK